MQAHPFWYKIMDYDFTTEQPVKGEKPQLPQSPDILMQDLICL